MRVMRLAIGLWLLVAGIQMHDWAAGLFSVFFLYQAVTDTGCCGSSGCAAPTRRSAGEVKPADEIEYEEIK